MAGKSLFGLDNNNYLINNEIVVLLNQLENIKYVEINFTNNYNSKVGKVRLYPIQNQINYDISKAVKSLFDLPNFDTEKNINEIEIEFKKVPITGTGTTQTITKYFIRGGVFDRSKNNFVADGYNINLNTFGATPFFENQYNDYKDYVIQGGIINFYLIFKSITLDHGCKGKMVRFLNQFGGYSYWYFHAFKIDNNSKPLDEVVRLNLGFKDNYHFSDIGVSLDSNIEFRGVVPLQFNELMKHLIASPEVYYLATESPEQWIRIKQNSNKHTYDSIQKVYEYKFDFSLENVNNPSVSW